MGITSAKKLEESLAKAKGVGLVEETFIIGDVEVTLRNLRPDEYEVALEECADLEELTYLNKFQESHVCRAIQELNGVSLRDIDFVECEEPDPNKKGQLRPIKRERHEWLRRHVLRTWSREAMYTAYRKFTDVVTLAEKKAKENVTFLTPDENAEEQFRRLVGELKELENDVPPALVTAILQEYGYTHYTQTSDREALEGLDRLASERPEGGTPDDGSSPSEDPPPSPSAPPSAPETPVAKQVQAAELLRKRVPLNQQVESAPEPAPEPPAATAQMPVAVQPPPMPVMSKRSAEFLAQEALYDEELRAAIPVGVVPPGAESGVAPELLPQGRPASREVAEIRPKQEHTDPRALAGIIERPPTGGLNPKFRRPG